MAARRHEWAAAPSRSRLHRPPDGSQKQARGRLPLIEGKGARLGSIEGSYCRAFAFSSSWRSRISFVSSIGAGRCAALDATMYCRSSFVNLRPKGMVINGCAAGELAGCIQRRAAGGALEEIVPNVLNLQRGQALEPGAGEEAHAAADEGLGLAIRLRGGWYVRVGAGRAETLEGSTNHK